MVFIYALELDDNKYYIGKTTEPEFRINQHFDADGSAWTKKYKPIRLHQLIPDCDDYDEDKYTLIYMDKYGINNVRGGSFVQITLNKSTIDNILTRNRNATDKCFLCGKNDHFAKDCINKKKLCIGNENFYRKNNSGSSINVCNRCHRKGHNENECYAKTDINGHIIGYVYESEEYCETTIQVNINNDDIPKVFSCNYCDKQFDTQKGATYHQNFFCKTKKQFVKK